MMPYHGLDHEPRQPEEVIRFAQYIARPPRIVFSESMPRDAAGLRDDLTVSPVRTVILNPYWREEITEAGLAHLVDEGDRTAGEEAHRRAKRARRYDLVVRLLKTGYFAVALLVVAWVIWRLWVGSR